MLVHVTSCEQWVQHGGGDHFNCFKYWISHTVSWLLVTHLPISRHLLFFFNIHLLSGAFPSISTTSFKNSAPCVEVLAAHLASKFSIYNVGTILSHFFPLLRKSTLETVSFPCPEIKRDIWMPTVDIVYFFILSAVILGAMCKHIEKWCCVEGWKPAVVRKGPTWNIPAEYPLKEYWSFSCKNSSCCMERELLPMAGRPVSSEGGGK